MSSYLLGNKFEVNVISKAPNLNFNAISSPIEGSPTRFCYEARDLNTMFPWKPTNNHSIRVTPRALLNPIKFLALDIHRTRLEICFRNFSRSSMKLSIL